MSKHHHRKHPRVHNHSHASHHERRSRLSRTQKNIVHVLMLVAIALSLRFEGAKLADWLFVALSATTEMS